MTNQGAGFRTGIMTVLLFMLTASGMVRAQTTTGGNDPFANLDAHLSEAASRTLDSIVHPQPAVTNSSASHLKDKAFPRGSDTLSGAKQRVERLRPVLEPILQEVGVPVKLAAVVLVESGGQPEALSPKGARGLWQLMPETARRYGLVVDEERDERLDILKSTRAAAQYLRDLYARFQDWRFALAAYNAGEQAVQRAVTRTGDSTFLVVSQILPRETQQYVPAVLDAFDRLGGPAAPQFISHARRQHILYATASQYR